MVARERKRAGQLLDAKAKLQALQAIFAEALAKNNPGGPAQAGRAASPFFRERAARFRRAPGGSMPRFVRCIPIVSLVLIFSLAVALSWPVSWPVSRAKAAVSGQSAEDAAHPAPDWDKKGAPAPDSADPAPGLEDGMDLPSVKSGGQASPAAVVKEMRPLLDIRALRRSLDDIGLLKAAGFAYQEGLTVPKDICPQPGDRDQAAVLSGMAASDQAYALFFGKAEDAARENRLLRKLSPKTHLPVLTAKEKNVLAKDPTGPAGREIIVRRSESQVRAMLAAASQNEANLRLLGAHLYGLFLERLYTTSVMVLAAAESDTLEPLHKVHAALSASQGKLVEMLARRGLLGNARFAATRLETVDSLLRLLASNHGRPSLAQMEEVLGIVREERAVLLMPRAPRGCRHECLFGYLCVEIRLLFRSSTIALLSSSVSSFAATAEARVHSLHALAVMRGTSITDKDSSANRLFLLDITRKSIS